MRIWFRLVGCYVDPEYEDSDKKSDEHLRHLQKGSDGELDSVHSKRDEFGADLVVLIAGPSYGYCGQAYNSPGSAKWAFSVVKYTCATGYYSFAHEMGHNMGVLRVLEAGPEHSYSE